MTALSNPYAPAFWDRIAPKYARKPIADPAAYEAKLARVSALLCPTDRVLEIGCGTGSTALRLAPGVAHVTATDISSGMIQIAQSKLGPDAPGNVTFRQADAMDPATHQPFDAICAFSLLHLVGDIPAVLARVRDQLKPGGLFISKTVCLKEASYPIRTMVHVLTAVGIAPRVTALGESDLIRHFRDADFEIQQTAHFSKGRMNPFIVARKLED